MYDICGIVRIEKYSYNKGEYFVSISHIISLIKEPEEEHCVSWCTQYRSYLMNICDNIPLDKLK